MSREFNIDKVFREVANQHEEAYNPQDWSDFQGQLKVNGLQTQPSLLTQVMHYIAKIVSTVVVVSTMPASTQIYHAPHASSNNQLGVVEQVKTKNNTVTQQTLALPKEQSHQTKGKTESKPLHNKRAVAQKQTMVASKPQDVASSKKQKMLAFAKNIKQPTPQRKAKVLTNEPIASGQNHNVTKRKPVFAKLQVAKNTQPINTKQTAYHVATIEGINTLDILPTQVISRLPISVDSIALNTKQATLLAYQENWVWSQRPRNVFQKLGRWLRLSPKPRVLISEGKPVTEPLAKKSEGKLGKKHSKQEQPSDKITVSENAKNKKREGLKLPRIKLGKFLSHVFGKQSPNKDSASTQPERQPSIYPIRERQLGVIYPFSTNGTDAYQYSNRLSLNALLGGAAALDGFEFSGIGNIEKDYVKGVQLAGFFNTVGNKVDGVQVAGLFNNVGNSLKGAQLAGFLNLAGMLNKNNRKSSASRLNLQAAGFGNINFGEPLNFQGAGFFNIGREINGFQGAGFVNISQTVTGFQGSGFVGLSEKIAGAQISGFVSVADQVEGLQMAGFLNIAGKVKGSQIGFINIADSLTNGVPIGFLSIIKNGYRKLEAWGSESLHANVGYKIGVRKFYNIFAVGGQFLPDNFRWGLGYGIGSIRDINPKNHLNFEAMVYHINEGKFWEDRLRLLNQIKLLYGREFGNGMSWQVGPTFNMLVSQDTPETNVLASKLPPYHFFDNTMNGVNVKLWAGVHVGLRF